MGTHVEPEFEDVPPVSGIALGVWPTTGDPLATRARPAGEPWRAPLADSAASLGGPGASNSFSLRPLPPPVLPCGGPAPPVGESFLNASGGVGDEDCLIPFAAPVPLLGPAGTAVTTTGRCCGCGEGGDDNLGHEPVPPGAATCEPTEATEVALDCLHTMCGDNGGDNFVAERLWDCA
mmetsp:Transcript_71441/g.180329  ORF Transcript_71441/g.180329 Transcript_71441/m.180329 type:complete len:178 (+) Transcript_71441:152-685(+)